MQTFSFSTILSKCWFLKLFWCFFYFLWNNAKIGKTSMNRRAYIFSEKIQNWIPEWLCSKSIHFPSKRMIILCFVEVILYGIFVVFICISIFKNLTKKVGFQAILLGRKSQELWVFLEKVWFSWWLLIVSQQWDIF